MLKIFKVFLYFIFMFVVTSCGFDEKKHYPMPVLDGLVVVIPFIDKVNTGIKKTGQSKSYNASGNEVTDNSVKDDGFYQMGTAHDYGRDDTAEIVFDRVTKLVWQDNNDAKTLTKSWVDAKRYCEDLILGPYSNWHLPSIVELQTIVRFDKTNPSLDDEVFINYSNRYSSIKYYWSTTPEKVNVPIIFLPNSRAWAREFGFGSVRVLNQAEENRVRCVNRTFSTN